MATKPRVFIGSSTEQLTVARKIRGLLDDDAQIVLWNESPEFKMGQSVLESLMNAKGRYDFAIMVLNPDDKIESRGIAQKATRDNVLFELGLFMGWLGRDRTFFVYNSGEDLKIPADLKGINCAVYKTKSDSLEADLGKAIDKIRDRMAELGALPRFDPTYNEAGIFNRIINAFIYPPYDSIESDPLFTVNPQVPESISSMRDVVEFSRDLFLYYLHPLIKPKDLKTASLRVYFAYFLGDGVPLKDGAFPKDCTDRNDVTDEKIKGHFVVGISNPGAFMEKRWLEGRVLAGYDEDSHWLSNCAKVFSRVRESHIGNVEDMKSRVENYAVEDEQSVYTVPVEWRLKGDSAGTRASIGVLAVSSKEPYAIQKYIKDRTKSLAILLGFLFSLYALNNQDKLDAGLKSDSPIDVKRLIGFSQNPPQDFARRVIALRQEIAAHFERSFLRRKIHALENNELVVIKAAS